MDWQPNNLTREAVGEFLESMVSVLPSVMGIDEVIAGCQVISLDPYGVGVGTYPRYIQVALRDRYYQDIMYRGGLSGLAVGDYVTVVHMRDGNRYELMTAGGSGGIVVNPAPVEAHYVTTQADATLTDEHVAQAGQWTAVTAAAGTFQTDFHPDNPVVVTGAGLVTEYATIQAAITAAVDCDTVLIPPGDYTEDVTLKDGVCVKGFGPRAKVCILGDEDVVTTAAGGWLENVTIVATDPDAGAFAGVQVSHNGICRLRAITIEVSQTGLNTAHGIGTIGSNSGTLVADNIDITVSSSAAVGGAIYGIDFSVGSYELELKNFKVTVAHTGATAVDDSYGIYQAGSTSVKATEGWLYVTAASAGTATDLFGTITYSEIVTTTDDTVFSGAMGVGLPNPAGMFEISRAGAHCDAFLSTYSAAAAYSRLRFLRSRSATLGTIVQTITGDNLGTFLFQGVDNTPAFDYGAFIRATQVGAAGVQVPTRIDLVAYSSTASNVPHLTLSPDGRVGGGVYTPTFSHQVMKDCADTWGFPSMGVADSTDAFVFLMAASGANNNLIAWDSNRALRFGTAGATVANPDGAFAEWMRITAAGHVYPGGNKTQDLGLAGNRWRTVYAANALNSGTSRLIESTRDCPVCRERMVRGTGGLCVVGEVADYMLAFCPVCGTAAMESIRHLPEDQMSKRRPPPKVELVGISVVPSSGLSRQVFVDFRYVDSSREDLDDSGVTNSTVLSEPEIEAFFMSAPRDRKEFLLHLGEREWYASEETRLMKETITKTQATFDVAISDLVGTDLLRNGVSR